MVFEIIEEKTKGVGVPQQCMRGRDPVEEYEIRTLDASGEFPEATVSKFVTEAHIRIAQSVIALRLNKVRTRWNKECPILASGDAAKFGWDCTGCMKNAKRENK